MEKELKNHPGLTMTEILARRKAKRALGRSYRKNAKEKSDDVFMKVIMLSMIIGAGVAAAKLQADEENRKLGVTRRFKNFVIFLMSGTTATIKAKLGFGIKTEDSLFLTKSQAVYAGLLANTGGFFTPAFLQMALLNTQNGDLATAIENMEAGVLGAEGAKKKAKNKVYATLKLALAYVNFLAANNQPDAVELINQAKMMVIGAPASNKQNMGAKYGLSTGEVILSTLAEKNAKGNYIKTSYLFQYSVSTVGGIMIWIDLPTTTVAHLTVIGMSLIPTSFRVQKTIRVLGKDVIIPWSAMVTMTPR
jgi:hypothetical protein